MKYNSEKLLYRRQFVLGPHFIEEFKSWKRIKVHNTIYLTVHPDLNTYKADYENKSITLLGYILDYRNPEANDSEIINILIRELSNCDSLDNFFECTYTFGGRWVLIVNDGNEIRLFNDATGLRQVFYTNISLSKDVWCGSQPGIIAEALNIDIDKESLEFIELLKKNDKQYWWPGDGSPYREIKHLLPNHYLNLETGLYHRYWPDRYLKSLPLKESVKKCSKILQGFMESAHNRFGLALTLTAGWESRVLLAASKNIKHKIFYFTLIYWDLIKNRVDATIASRLLSKLKLKHNVIKCPHKMEDEFKNYYNRNVIMAREVYGTVAQGIYNYYPQDKVCVKGNAGEVARQFYRLKESNGKDITAEQIAKLTQMGTNPFAIKAFDKWLKETTETYNINILDLFYWEQRMGNWQAMSQLEWDIVQEVFTPFNCRILLTNLLSVDEKYRERDEPELFREIITSLWPEVLGEPVNPPYKTGIIAIIKKILHRIYRWFNKRKKYGKWWWWMWFNMQFSDLPYLGRLFTWLAGLPLGHFRRKWPLAGITHKPYISPKAQVFRPDLHLGQGCFIDDYVTIASSIKTGGSIFLEEEVYIHRGTIIEVSQHAKINIGRRTHIQANCILSGHLSNLRIGRNVMIAPNCGFFPYQHKTDDLSTPMRLLGAVSKGDIVIEDDVWLGMGVKVMDGVRIGQGSVVAAGAVVTKSVPPRSVVGGVPARIIKQRGVK